MPPCQTIFPPRRLAAINLIVTPLICITAILLAFLLFSLLPETDTLQPEPFATLYRMGPGIKKPQLLHRTEPEYSETARHLGVEGKVLLQFVVDELGWPKDIGVVLPLGYGLDQQAVKCLLQWQFKPATKDGRPVQFLATAEFTFLVLNDNADLEYADLRRRFYKLRKLLSENSKSGLTKSELSEIQNLASQGLPEAQYKMGIWQIKGEKLPLDPLQGAAYVRAAANGHYAPALFFVGSSSLSSQDTLADKTEGLHLVQQSALLGDREAQLFLGRGLDVGGSLGADLNEARRFLNLCATAGDPECQFRLGRLLRSSPEPSKELTLEALAWFELSGKHGYPNAEDAAAAERLKVTPEQLGWLEKLEKELEPCIPAR